MSWQPTPQGTAPRQYSPDGRWCWDGRRWVRVPTSGSTDVTIWAAQMRPGGLPAICVKTGQPADHGMRVRIRTVPRWTLLLLLLGALPYLIVRLTAGVQVIGHLPVARAVARRVRAVSISGLIGALLGVLAVVVAVSAGSGLPPAVGGILLLVGLAFLLAGVALMVGPLAIWLRAVVRKQDGYPNDRVVVLRGVHPNFAEAVRAQQAAFQRPGYPPAARPGQQRTWS